MRTNRKLITFEQSLDLPEDKCEEVINGVSHHAPPPGVAHARAIRRIFVALESRLDPAAHEILFASFGQLISKQPLTYRNPDLAVYRSGDVGGEHYVSSTPELIVEVVSPGNRKGNLDELLRHYAAIGVPAVWFVYLDRRQVRTLALSDRRYLETACLSGGPVEVLGATIDAGEIWGHD